MKRVLFFISILIIASSACSRNTDDPVNQKPSTLNPPYPNPSAPQTGNFIPGLADSNLMRAEVYLDSTELLTLESYPLQFVLALKGSLPTPCHQLRVAVSLPDFQNKIAVDVYSVADPNTICAQMLEPFEADFPLGNFPAGRYTLWVNGIQTAEFQP